MTDVTIAAGQAAARSLPPLWRGSRRGWFVRLALVGVLQAVAAGGVAIATPMMFSAPDDRTRLQLTLTLLAMALSVAVLRWRERVLAEQVGQDYVRQLRTMLVRGALVGGRGTHFGITVTRTTNDLTAVRNWVALGIAPMVVGVPLIVGVVFVLFSLSPALGAGYLVVVIILGLLLGLLAPVALRRSREVRRRRGRMSVRIANTVQAATGIRAAGGVDRELKGVDKLSGGLIEAAIARARVSGALRGAAAAASIVAMVVVGAIGAWVGELPATVTTALLLVGITSTPITDLGRVLEYRQSYLAACIVIGPALDRSREARRQERALARAGRGAAGEPEAESRTPGVVHIAGVEAPDEGELPELVAEPGARVIITSADAQRVRAVLDALLVEPGTQDAWIQVDGRRLNRLDGRSRRGLYGYASSRAALPDGTITRIVRYRAPDSEEPIGDVLDRVGLADLVTNLPKGERTRLKRGGEPLDTDGRARLQIASALYGDPPLLVLDGVAGDLTPLGTVAVRHALAEYPGVVLIAGAAPETLVGHATVWDLDQDQTLLATRR